MTRSVNISVIIPVFNRAAYISESIKSILSQTLEDFELIIVNDGSTDETVEVVEQFDDPRIRLIHHEENRGISQARNTGLQHVQGEYIAWLDSDDYAYPDRLAKQSSYLKDHPQIAMVGSCAGLRGPEGERLKGYRIPPFSYGDICAWLLFRSAFQQSSIFGRSDILTRYPYRIELPVCEDFDVFVRIARQHQVCNQPYVLIDRRIHPDQIYRLSQDSIRTENRTVVMEQLRHLGINASEEDIERHALLGSVLKHRDHTPDMEFLDWAEHWLMGLRGSDIPYTKESINFATGFFWAKACYHAIPRLGRTRVLGTFMGSPLSLAAISGNGRRWLQRVVSIWFGRRTLLAND